MPRCPQWLELDHTGPGNLIQTSEVVGGALNTHDLVWLSGSALVGTWSQELESGIEPRYFNSGHWCPTARLNAHFGHTILDVCKLTYILKKILMLLQHSLCALSSSISKLMYVYNDICIIASLHYLCISCASFINHQSSYFLTASVLAQAL